MQYVWTICRGVKSSATTLKDDVNSISRSKYIIYTIYLNFQQPRQERGTKNELNLNMGCLSEQCRAQ